jgi:hypothetical protein
LIYPEKTNPKFVGANVDEISNESTVRDEMDESGLNTGRAVQAPK